jgi:disease resistance protein RPS2
MFAPITVKEKVECLRKLETLECHFEVHSWLCGVSWQDPRTKHIQIPCRTMERQWLSQLPNNIEELAIYNCNVVMSLCDVSSSIRYAAELERIDLSHCNSMESLVSSSWLCSSPLPFPSCFYLVELQVRLFVMLLGVHNYPVDLKLVLW